MNKVAKLTERDTQAYLFSIEKIVKDVGKTLLETNFKEISDTHTYNGHESSTLDETARELMQNAIERYLPLFQGFFRCNPYEACRVNFCGAFGFRKYRGHSRGRRFYT